jgi:polyhydroxybutyrate depolymerase
LAHIGCGYILIGGDSLELIIDKFNLSAILIGQMKKKIIISTISYLASTGLIQAQVISDSILVDGNYRTFHYNKPGSVKKGSSLVFVLHGSGGSGKDLMDRTATLRQKTMHENVLLVYPNGYKKYWNECRKVASSLANQENINEEAFFGGMIVYFEKKYKIDETQVFAVGTSGGGHMCYKLAMTMPSKFSAVTAIIANLPAQENMDCSDAKVPMAIMIANGTADPTNPYEGGMMQGGNFIMGTVRSTDNTFHYWSSLAGYAGNPVKETLPDTDPEDGKIIERYTFKSQGKPEVVLLKIIGGKHDYPNDIDIHVEAWDFFKRQIKK